MIKEKQKKQLIDALRKSLCNITMACKNVGIDRGTFYNLLEKDANFKAEYDAILEEQIDFAENSLMQQIKEKNPTSTIFFLKTKGKKRGYTEQQSLDVRINKIVENNPFMPDVEENNSIQ